jgi:type 2 lantibiotic biosynthesis protein LanM
VPQSITARRLPISVKQHIAARAATLSERVDALAGDTGRPSEPQDPETVATMRSWIQAFSRGDEEAFQHRLAWDGLDMDAAWRVVAGSADASVESLPPWIDWLDRIFDHAPVVRGELTEGRLEEADANAWTDEPPFVELWVAPLRAARQELVRRVPESARTRATAPALRALDQQLMRDVSHWAVRATWEQFRGTLEDPADEAPPSADVAHTYHRFIDAMLEAGLAPLWVAYPVLARHVAIVASGWVDSTSELLTRLDADWTALAARFADGGDPGLLTAVRPALSDPHGGRRRVAALDFESGLRLIYKPRDLALDRTFNDCLTWSAAHGLPAAPRALEVLEREGYGWVEFASHESLASHDHARGYYRQSGSLLCLAHVLRGNDLHMENLVATGRGPVLVDIEPLLQPVTTSRARELDAAAPSDSHDAPESCLATGLLSMFEIGPDGQVFDVGGLRGDGTGALPLPRLVWKSLRTPDLHFTRETQFAASVKNRVSVLGIAQVAEDYADEIVAGFSDTYRWLLAHREELLRADGPLAAFARCRTRVIPRPTNQYAMLATVLATPRYQRDGALRAGAIDILLRPFSGASTRPGVWPALVAERRAIEALDVPYFWVPCDSLDVHAGGDPIVHGYFARSGLKAVTDGLAQLSEQDRSRQARILARALTESPQSRLTSTFVTSVPDPELVEPLSALFVDAAIWLGNEIQRRAVPSPSGPTWPAWASQPPTLCPHTLYDGTVGVALFFAGLHRVTGRAQWADFCRETLEPVEQSVARGDPATWTASGIGVGDGIGSMVYGLALIGSWLDDRRVLEYASQLASTLAARIDRDTCDDVLSGAAGGVLALLALNRVRPDPTLLAWADACAARLVARQVAVDDGSTWPAADGRHVVGFAHGAAGIAYALDRLFHESGTASVGNAAASGFRFVRRQYLPREGDWPVAATTPGDGSAGGTPLVAWCHGAPGVALAEALAPSRSATTPQEIEGALARTAQWLPRRSDYLCCGTLGRSDVLLTIGRHLDRPAAVAAAVTLAERVTERALGAGHFRLGPSAFEYRVFDPGFFRGLSGIGYVLLRLAAPTRLPSVLAFEAPGI